MTAPKQGAPARSSEPTPARASHTPLGIPEKCPECGNKWLTLKVDNGRIDAATCESCRNHWLPEGPTLRQLADQRQELLEALKDARSRLQEFIGADCECDNTHEQNGTTCALCSYNAAIAKTEVR